jgi:hypothetical protein
MAARPLPWHKWGFPSSAWKDVMVYKPNYSQQRAERNRAKQAKQEAKQEAKRLEREEEARRKQLEESGGAAPAEGPGPSDGA